MEKIIPVIEEHPLQPFLPSNAKLLMLGSFPPQRKRWSMDFFYPNLQNDMWRIFGHIFFQDKDHFLYPNKKAFNKELIIDFLNNKGIALSREKLLSDVWGYDFYGDDRTVDTHIKMLRSILKDYRKFIITLRGMGYKFEV